ncbi:Tetratricopeptide repeat family protein [Seminavis robusta]|uniref:Tetratricopeptide repeat family protein n=1 Tax=Seminavis robusta TaxID=568900 RepID=A0A9N8H2S0_9STRA|nr:Tetratricopeptide repeat family protein [Seminavis robusta]|eukprot:Sro13_g010200.1 Tetratricopeptide repeat family protein (480) ;mRNA; r:150691-152390
MSADRRNRQPRSEDIEIDDVQTSMESTFYDIEDLRNDEPGLIRRKGINITCPIDGRMGAAYVHCVQGEENVGRATPFLSWTWGYTVGDVVDTLVAYCSASGYDPKLTFVWICSFCINQHRVVEQQKLQRSGMLRTAVEGMMLLPLNRGKHKEALQQHNMAVNIRETFLGSDHPDTALSLDGRGCALAALGDIDGALKQHEKALEIWERAPEVESKAKKALCHSFMGTAFQLKNLREAALHHFRKGLEMQELLYVRRHPETAATHHALGSVCIDLGDHETALYHLGIALSVRRSLLGDLHPETMVSQERITKVERTKNEVSVEQFLVRALLCRLHDATRLCVPLESVVKLLSKNHDKENDDEHSRKHKRAIARAGCIKAVIAAMQMHPSVVRVQVGGCSALELLAKDTDKRVAHANQVPSLMLGASQLSSELWKTIPLQHKERHVQCTTIPQNKKRMWLSDTDESSASKQRVNFQCWRCN